MRGMGIGIRIGRGEWGGWGGEGAEEFCEFGGDVGVSGVRDGGIFGLIAEVFVGPEPEVGLGFDEGFEGIPGGLSDFLEGGVWGVEDGGVSDDEAGAIGLGLSGHGDEEGVGALGENGMEEWDAHFELEARDDSGGLGGAEIEVDEEGGGGAAFDDFEHAEEGIFLGDDGLSGDFAEGFEEGGEAGIFEFFGDDHALEAEHSGGDIAPFPVALVDPEENRAAFFGEHLGANCFEANELGEVMALGWPGSMHPEEIEHGAEEILVRGASDGDFLGVGEGGTEDGLEVLEGDMASAGIEEEGEGAEAIGEAHGAFAGEVGEGEDEEAAGEGFEVVAKIFPTGHWGGGWRGTGWG